MFPMTKVPLWVPIFDPQPYVAAGQNPVPLIDIKTGATGVHPPQNGGIGYDHGPYVAFSVGLVG